MYAYTESHSYQILESVSIKIRAVITCGEGTLIVKDYKELCGVMEMS